MELNVRNVNEALPVAWHMLKKDGVKRASRNGTMLEYPGVVSTIYRRPMERVLFSALRDANPFFHLFESMWMLANRNDVGWLVNFLPRMKEFSDDGVSLNGAYGHRWRFSLPKIVAMLHHKPEERRAFMPLYFPEDVARTSKDIPCNVGVDFKVRNQKKGPPLLDMTVFNRSNDVIWGAYGANVVHFSILQQWLAERLDAFPGQYAQVSASFHIYPDFDVMKKLDKLDPAPDDPYERGEVKPYDRKILTNWKEWDRELKLWMENPWEQRDWTNEWFGEVLVPLYNSWKAYKTNASDEDIVKNLEMCVAEDWSRAAYEWIERRLISRRSKEKSNGK